MSSFEERYYIENPTPLQALGRNLRLLWMLLCAGLMWAGRGWLVRRALRNARRGGKPVILEDVAG